MSAYGTVTQPAQNMPQLRTRSPTGLPSWPLVLVEGPEKTGKSWLCALLTASSNIGRAVWLDWVEGEGDHYAAIPGVGYELIEHDGTFEDIGRQIYAARREAQAALDRGEKPMLLVIDSMTAEWDSLKQWANQRACNTESARRKLARNPGSDIPVPMNVWNDVHDRHYRIMRLLMTFPGIVVMTARGKDIAAVGDDGKPTGERDYRVEAHKNLAYDASAWVRLSRTQPPQVIGARSVIGGGRPGQDASQPIQDLSLEWLTFQQLLNGSHTGGQTRSLPEAPPVRPPSGETAGEQPSVVSSGNTGVPNIEPAEPDWEALLEANLGNYPGLQALWNRASNSGAGRGLLERIQRAGQACKPPAAPVDRVDDNGNQLEAGPDQADPATDPIRCEGSQQPPEVDLTRTEDDGKTLGLCPRCTRWVPVLDHGMLENHAPQNEDDQ